MATITIEDVKKAKSYMPAETKANVSFMMAKLCVYTDKSETTEEGQPLPPMRVENRVRKLQCLHGVLVGWYFGGEFEKDVLRFKDESGNVQERDIAMCMSVKALNSWLEDHPINQLERLKKEKTVANKVYDILYDFKAFEMMLTSAIREELEKANDPAIRIAQMLAVQTTPESLRETIELLEEYREKTGVMNNA